MKYTHLPSIDCYYSDKPLPVHIESEAHFEYEMLLITKGSGTLFINHKEYPVSEHSLVFISRFERHSILVSKTPYERYVAAISGDFIMSYIKYPELISIFLQRPDNFSHVISLNNDTYNSIVPLFQKLKNESLNKNSFYIAQSMSYLLCMLINLYRVNPNYFPGNSSNISVAVINAQKYINDYYHEKIKLQDIADMCFVNRHSLSIAFKKMVGISFKDYLILFRITEAKKLLLTTNHSISDIAEQVGYINVNNFIRIFTEKEKTTPLQYRKSHIINITN